jgi:transcriptional regulator
MYIPASFKIEELQELHDVIRAAPLPNLVISDDVGLVATPLPLLLDESEGEFGVLYGHVAKANPIWRATANPIGLVIFMGPDAYVTPSWYATKRDTGKVVPTWNYVAVHAYGVPEFIDDEDRLLAIVSRQTNEQEVRRPQPWAVSDAPEGFIKNQLSAIVGVKMPIRSIEGKRKMSQNRPLCDRIGVANGLSASERENDRAASALIPR